MQFEIKNPLTDQQWQAVENAALKILETTGLLVDHAEICQVLAGIAGVRVEGRRVRLDRRIVLEYGMAVKGTTTYDTRLMAGSYSHNYLDADSFKPRPSTRDDLIRSVRQANALGIGVCAPVVPMDVAGPRQEIVMERITHENARYSYGSGQATSVAAAEAAIEMSAVVKRPCELEIWVTSPLNLDPGGLDILWQLRQRRPQVHLCNMPVQGMTAPISLPGVLAQSAAECLGAAAILRLLDIASNVAFRVDAFWAFAMDMRTTNVLVSGPDYLRLMLFGIFFAKRYGIGAPMGKALLTSAKLPDAQAGAEKAAQALVAAMAGAGAFVAAGTLAEVEIFSPLQMIIDHEIMRFVDACAKPIEFLDNDFLLDVIEEVGPRGTFLAEESTVARYRDFAWEAQLFNTTSYPNWAAAGSPQLLDRAREKLASLKYADGPVVSDDQQRELARIEAWFTRGMPE